MDATVEQPAMANPATSSLLVEVARFAQVLRARLGTLAVCVLLGAAAGIGVFMFATRVYESSAEILVLQTGGAVLDSKQGSQRNVQDDLPTYQKVLTSTKPNRNRPNHSRHSRQNLQEG